MFASAAYRFEQMFQVKFNQWNSLANPTFEITAGNSNMDVDNNNNNSVLTNDSRLYAPFILGFATLHNINVDIWISLPVPCCAHYFVLMLIQSQCNI